MKHHFTTLWVTVSILLGLSTAALGQNIIPNLFLVAKDQPQGIEGWVVNNASTNNAKTDYWKLLVGSDLISPELNLSNYTDVNVSLKVQSFGSITNNSDMVQLEMSENSGSWVTVGENQHTTSSAAIKTWSVSSTQPNVRFRISAPNATSGAGARLFSCEITGKLDLNRPSLSPISAIDYGEQNLNTTATQIIHVKGVNLSGDLTVTVAGDGFSGSTSLTSDEALSGKDVAIDFTPTTAGVVSGSVTISGGGLVSDVVVALSGEGVLSTPFLEPIGALDFEKINIGSSLSKDMVVSGRNLTGDLTVSVEGDGFSGSTVVLAADAMADGGKIVAISFTPLVAGVASGTVTISGGGLASDLVVDLSAEGRDPSLSFFEDFESITGAADSYTGSDVTCESGLWNIWGFTTMDGSDHKNGSRSIRLRGNSGDQCKVEMKFDKPNGLGTLSFAYASYSTHDGGGLTAYYSTNSGSTWTKIGTVDPVKWTEDPSMKIASFEVNVAGDVRVKIARDVAPISGSSTVNIDDIEMTNYIPVTEDPSIVASDVSFGTVDINTSTVKTLSVLGANLGEDISVVVSGEGFTTTVTSVDKSGGSISISFIALNKGDYVGSITLSSGSTTVVYDLSASAIDPADYIVENIAALKEKGTGDQTSVFTLSGDVTFVYRNGRNIYVQDETGGLLLYDAALPIISTTYSEGDVISGGIKGTVTEYRGLLEFIPTENTSESVENNGSVVAEDVTIAALLDNYSSYVSRLVNIVGVTFGEGSFHTAAATNIDITQNGATIVCRNSFLTLDMTPISFSNVRGFVSIFDNNVQIFPRSNDDIYTVVGCDPNQVADVRIINHVDGIVIDQLKSGDVVSVYNANGTLLVEQIADCSRQSIALGKGFYVVKVGNSSVKVVR